MQIKCGVVQIEMESENGDNGKKECHLSAWTPGTKNTHCTGKHAAGWGSARIAGDVESVAPQRCKLPECDRQACPKGVVELVAFHVQHQFPHRSVHTDLLHSHQHFDQRARGEKRRCATHLDAAHLCNRPFHRFPCVAHAPGCDITLRERQRHRAEVREKAQHVEHHRQTRADTHQMQCQILQRADRMWL